MKRRNFLKGLSILPVGIGMFRKKVEEPPKPEPVKTVEPSKIGERIDARRTLGPQSGQNLTACSFVFTVAAGDWEQ